MTISWAYLIAAPLMVMQALPAIPESLLMLYGGADEGGPDSGLFLQVALQNGVLMRTEVGGCALVVTCALCPNSLANVHLCRVLSLSSSFPDANLDMYTILGVALLHLLLCNSCALGLPCCHAFVVSAGCIAAASVEASKCLPLVSLMTVWHTLNLGH
eukprot:1159960-Pelagomonas_calceolata.AAC.1